MKERTFSILRNLSMLWLGLWIVIGIYGFFTILFEPSISWLEFILAMGIISTVATIPLTIVKFMSKNKEKQHAVQ